MQQTAIAPGARVTILKNDVGVKAGSVGRFVGRHPETGNALVDVDGRGRVAFLPDQIQPEEPNGHAPAPEPVRASPMAGKQHSEEAKERMRAAAQRRHAGVSRELYLDHVDAADELGVSQPELNAMAKALQFDACERGRCRYTLARLGRLKALQELMRELELPAGAAGRVQAWHARKMEGAG